MDIRDFFNNNPKLKKQYPIFLFYYQSYCMHCKLEIQYAEQKEENNRIDFFSINGLDETIYFNLDHIVPQSKTQPISFCNLQVLCVSCNEKKKNQSERKIYLIQPDDPPADFYFQLVRHQDPKSLYDYYPDWKPYYGF